MRQHTMFFTTRRAPDYARVTLMVPIGNKALMSFVPGKRELRLGHLPLNYTPPAPVDIAA